MKYSLIFTLTIIACTSSCRKQKAAINNTLTGKWQLVQTYDGYAMGGTYTWTNVPANFSKHIEFFASGQFEENNNLGGSPQNCSGSFVVQPDSILVKNSSCYIGSESYRISEQTATGFILSHTVTEGVIKEKYTRAD